MFALHETTQRRVCRVTFLTFCVVPTLLTLVGIAYCNRPWRQADWQQTLAQRLHVRATLDEISRPLPGVTKLTNLHLADLRTNHPLGSIEKLSFHRQNYRLTLHADHLVLEAEQLPAFVSAIATWLATGELELLDFHAEQLTINGPSLRVVQLKDLSIASVYSDSTGQQFQLKAMDDAGETFQLTLESQGGTLRCLVDAQQAALPAWLLGKFVPGLSGCGDATFHGTLTATYENQHTQGKLKGQLSNVDLQTWIGNDGPHHLQGVAQVQLEQIEWLDEGILVAQGNIKVGRGTSSFSLLLNARDICGCTTGPTWETLNSKFVDKPIPFDQLSFSFRMNDAGIAVTGHCEEKALMTFDQIPLLFAPLQLRPVGELVQLLDYRRQPGWLPATRKAHVMAGKLPLPENSRK